MMRLHFFPMLAMLAILGGACSSSGPEATTADRPADPAAQSPATDGSPTVETAATIAVGPTGIAEARFGMTVAQLKEAVGEGAALEVMSPFIVDFDALAIVRADAVDYYVLYPADTILGDGDRFEALMTDSGRARTDAGVGPGTLLEQAEDVYGDATLAFNLSGEGREYVQFADFSADNIAFRMGAYGDDSLSGVYPDAIVEYNQTREYKEGAAIRAVLVTCPELRCLAE